MGPRVGLDAVVKRKFPSPCRELNLGRPARSPACHTSTSIREFSISLMGTDEDYQMFYNNTNKCTIIQYDVPLM
jgi:hypothetical protein